MMVPLFRFVVFALLSFQTLESGHALADIKCMDFVQELMTNNLGNMIPCINEGNYKSPKERAAGYNCIMKCVLAKSGALAPSGKISVMVGLGFILEHFPNEYIFKALTEITKCQEHANINVNDPADTKCEKMRPLISCGVDFMFNICKV